MGGGKYRVEQEGQFLGHWCSTSPREAIAKMLESPYASVYNINKCGWFDVTRGEKTYHITGEE